MTTQDPQAKPSQSSKEQAEKLRRVLSMKDPAPVPPKPSETQPKHAAR